MVFQMRGHDNVPSITTRHRWRELANNDGSGGGGSGGDDHGSGSTPNTTSIKNHGPPLPRKALLAQRLERRYVVPFVLSVSPFVSVRSDTIPPFPGGDNEQ